MWGRDRHAKASNIGRAAGEYAVGIEQIDHDAARAAGAIETGRPSWIAGVYVTTNGRFEEKDIRLQVGRRGVAGDDVGERGVLDRGELRAVELVHVEEPIAI